MRRGEVWTAAARGYGSKPRPVVIVQAEGIDDYDSVVLCLLTSFDSTSLPFRVRVDPSPTNGLTRTSWVMSEKVLAIPKSRLGHRIGVLEDDILEEVADNLRRLLGLD